MRKLLAMLFWLLAAEAAFAQAVHPNWERGVAAEKAYEFGDIDTVNLFNGNLNVAVPIGQTYHLGGALSYAFVLHYGGNNWEFGSVDRSLELNTEWKHFSFSYPAKRQNAGFGWRLSFGEFVSDLPCVIEGTPFQDSGLTYVAPDGGTHCFRDVPHNTNEPRTAGVFYTTDGSYMRLDLRGGQRKLEFPDGTDHSFDSIGRLEWMNDRFGNWVHVEYGSNGIAGAPSWHITDSAGRAHDVYFRGAATYVEDKGYGFNVAHNVVSRVRLQSTGGQDAEYTFQYEGEGGTWSTIPRHPIASPGELDPDLSSDTKVALLLGVSMPHSLSWNFQYVRCSNGQPEGDCPDSSGSLRQVTLPTGGQLQWDYQQFILSGTWFQLHPEKPVEGTLFMTPVAVATRTMVDWNGAVLGFREYEQEWEDIGDGEHRVVVTDHEGGPSSNIIRRTRNYFSVCSFNCPAGEIRGEYGLPFSRRAASNDQPAWSITSEDLGPDASSKWLSIRRRRYVQYEADINLGTLLSGMHIDYNRRLQSERTVYEDGKYADTLRAHFDGLGHYREMRTDGNFGSRDQRTTFTNFNPLRGDYGQPGYSTFPTGASDGWVINTFNYEKTTENLMDATASSPSASATTLTTETCFDTAGFLVGRRTLLESGANPSRDGKDLLARFTRDARGNIAGERYYGGDRTPVSIGTGCDEPTSGALAYELAHTWSAAGALTRSVYKNGGVDGARVLSQTADGSTGYVTESLDSANVGTSISYDLLGRITGTAPSTTMTAGRSASTAYSYALSPPRVTITQSAPSGLPSPPVSTLQFDGFGRLLEQQSVMPDNATSVVKTEYNSLGWKTKVYEADTAPSHFTQFVYDFVGRPKLVTAPDNSTVAFDYTGISQTSRTVSVHTDSGDQNSTTIERYDRQGKLWKVTEPNNTITAYAYDIGDRLHTACMNVSSPPQTCGQLRTFNYDNRGFLSSETHPEKPTTSYSDYDARGHAHAQNDGVASLVFDFDHAERLTKISDADGYPWKEFEFEDVANGTNDYRLGKLVKAHRHNWIRNNSSSFNLNFQVVESYVYGGRDGRASQRVTKEKNCAVALPTENCKSELAGSADLVTFSTALAYEPGGNPSSIVYPTCPLAPCSGAVTSSPTITRDYARGMLTTVTMPGGANNLTYLSNGMVGQVQHANGVTDIQEADPSGMRRPSMLRVTGALDSSTCTAPTIAQQPASVTVTANSNTTLTASVSADSNTALHPLVLQWYLGASPSTAQPISGATTNSLTLNSVTTTNSYWLQASNGCGSAANSTTATVTVCTPATITGQPTGATVASGQTVTMTVAATGTNLRFQWYAGASGVTTAPVTGATSSVLSFVPNHNSLYWVQVANDCSTPANSVAVSVTVTPPSAPSGLVATYQSGAIVISWNPVSPPTGVGSYVLERAWNRTGFRTFRTLPASGTSFVDTAFIPGVAYLYRVRVVDGNGVTSGPSNVDVATTVAFTDDPLVAGVTPIRKEHVAELRQAIDALGYTAGQSMQWQPNFMPAIGTAMTAAQITQMRTALGTARATLGLPSITYTRPTITSGMTILKVDIEELRNGVK